MSGQRRTGFIPHIQNRPIRFGYKMLIKVIKHSVNFDHHLINKINFAVTTFLSLY